MTLSTDMLAAFVRVAERHSVSSAAADLGVAKSVVSKRVAQLEAAVNATLFSRSTRHVALTPAGEAYLDFARRALVEVAAAQERLRDLSAELAGRIRLTAPVSWGQGALAHALPGFLQRHPAVQVELLLADRVIDIAREGIDLALRWSAQRPLDLVSQPVAPVRWQLVATPAYLAQSAPLDHPEDLLEHQCLCYWRDAGDDAWRLSRDGQDIPVRVSGPFHVNSAEAVAAAALGGLGVALLPDYLCRQGLDHGTLRAVLTDWQPCTPYGEGICAVAAPERLRIARNRALLEHLQQHFASRPPASSSHQGSA